MSGCHFNDCLWNTFLISLDVDIKVTFKTSNAVISLSPNTDIFTWYTVSPLVSVLDLENDPWFKTLVLAEDDSEVGGFSFVGINSVAAESFPSSTEILEELIAEDGTLIFSEFNLFVWTSDNVGSVLSVWE